LSVGEAIAGLRDACRAGCGSKYDADEEELEATSELLPATATGASGNASIADCDALWATAPAANNPSARKQIIDRPIKDFEIRFMLKK
jgi:hypothetical protein